MNRGRPRHDDILTPREWEVMDRLQRGMTNEEIAADLGITFNTVKYHVAEIYGKLGLTSRQEAVAWRGRPRAVFGLAPLGALLAKFGTVSPGKLAGAGAIGAAGIGLAALLGGVLLNQQNAPGGEPALVVPVRWVEEELPPPVSWEAEEPFEDFVPAGEDDLWRAYLVRDGNAPEVIAETDRYLGYGVTWHGDEVILDFWSRKEWLDGRLGQPIQGIVAYEPGNPEPAWERITDHSRASVAEDGSRYLVEYEFGELYFQPVGGDSLHLEGLEMRAFAAFAPEGEYFFFSGYEDGADTLAVPLRFFIYVARPGDTEAVKVDTSGDDRNGYYLPRWSPDGTRLAFPEGSDIMVLDVERRVLRRFPMGRGSAISVLQWSEDGRYIVYAGGIMDATDGTILRDFSGETGSGRLSPDSRYLVLTGDSGGLGSFGLPACREVSPGFYANRTMIYDLRGDAAPIEALSCLDLPYAPREWIDDEHVLMAGYTCPACRPAGPKYVYALLDVTDGSVVHLTGDPANVRVGVAPDGQFLIAGETLAVYAADGSLMYEHALDGEPVRYAEWSPDGRSIVFLTGPEIDIQAVRQASP